MYLSPITARTLLGAAVLPGDPPSAVERPRGIHARLLETAAARRRRALERRDCERLEDAAYWLQCAPAALVKAMSIRRAEGFAVLP
jgi:hypothetical protein